MEIKEAAKIVLNCDRLHRDSRNELVLRLLAGAVRPDDVHWYCRISEDLAVAMRNNPEIFSADESGRIRDIATAFLPKDVEVNIPAGQHELHIRDVYPMAEAEREAAARKSKK